MLRPYYLDSDLVGVWDLVRYGENFPYGTVLILFFGILDLC